MPSWMSCTARTSLYLSSLALCPTVPSTPLQLSSSLKCVLRRSYTSDPVLSAAGWASVLHLASEWNFPSIRDLAIKNFTPSASDVDKVVFGHRYKFEEWLLPGYTGLCERKEPLTLAEAMRLGMEDVVAINEAREAIRNTAEPQPTPTIKMTQELRCPRGYTYNYSFDSTQNTTSCLCGYGCSIKLPTITSTPPSVSSASKDTVEKVKLHIPRHSFRAKYVPSMIRYR